LEAIRLSLWRMQTFQLENPHGTCQKTSSMQRIWYTSRFPRGKESSNPTLHRKEGFTM